MGDVEKQQRAPRYSGQVKINPIAGEPPPSIYSNHVLVNELNQEVTFVFAQIRLPLDITQSTGDPEQDLAERGLTPQVVASVTVPSTLVQPLIGLLNNLNLGSEDADEVTMG